MRRQELSWTKYIFKIFTLFCSRRFILFAETGNICVLAIPFNIYIKRIVKKGLTEKHDILGKKKRTKKKYPHLILGHLWLGNTCAVWVFPGGCSQASKDMITTLEPMGMHSNNPIAVWYVINGLKAAVWILSLIYNDPQAWYLIFQHSQCNKRWPLERRIRLILDRIHLFTKAKEILDIFPGNSCSIPTKLVEEAHRAELVSSRQQPVCVTGLYFISFAWRRAPSVHSELGEAAESLSSFSRSLGEDDCPPFTLFHFILLFWNHTFTCWRDTKATGN